MKHTTRKCLLCARRRAEIRRLDAIILKYEEQETDFTPDDWDALDAAITQRARLIALVNLDPAHAT